MALSLTQKAGTLPARPTSFVRSISHFGRYTTFEEPIQPPSITNPTTFEPYSNLPFDIQKEIEGSLMAKVKCPLLSRDCFFGQDIIAQITVEVNAVDLIPPDYTGWIDLSKLSAPELNSQTIDICHRLTLTIFAPRNHQIDIIAVDEHGHRLCGNDGEYRLTSTWRGRVLTLHALVKRAIPRPTKWHSEYLLPNPMLLILKMPTYDIKLTKSCFGSLMDPHARHLFQRLQDVRQRHSNLAHVSNFMCRVFVVIWYAMDAVQIGSNMTSFCEPRLFPKQWWLIHPAFVEAVKLFALLSQEVVAADEVKKAEDAIVTRTH